MCCVHARVLPKDVTQDLEKSGKYRNKLPHVEHALCMELLKHDGLRRCHTQKKVQIAGVGSVFINAMNAMYVNIFSRCGEGAFLSALCSIWRRMAHSSHLKLEADRAECPKKVFSETLHSTSVWRILKRCEMMQNFQAFWHKSYSLVIKICRSGWHKETRITKAGAPFNYY